MISSMPKALSDAIIAAHDEAVQTNRETYRDPVTGYQVWTRAALLARETCCESGCRHCPYDKSPSTA